jgi:hypothetical protein
MQCHFNAADINHVFGKVRIIKGLSRGIIVTGTGNFIGFPDVSQTFFNIDTGVFEFIVVIGPRYPLKQLRYGRSGSTGIGAMDDFDCRRHKTHLLTAKYQRIGLTGFQSK